MNISGNTILITGGSSGIGLEMAKQFLNRNNKVIITGRDKKKLQHSDWSVLSRGVEILKYISRIS